MNSIVFVTGNPSKFQATQRYITFPLHKKSLDVTEIQSFDLKTIVTHKVIEAYSHIKKPVLVEDTSLQFNALGKLPGPYIKWFVEEIGNERLCTMLNNFSDRSAVVTVTYGFYDGIEVKTFSGSLTGEITTKPRGNRGFGWDPIFQPNGLTKTIAELSLDELFAISPRKIALKKLENFLRKNKILSK